MRNKSKDVSESMCRWLRLMEDAREKEKDEDAWERRGTYRKAMIAPNQQNWIGRGGD